MKKALVFAFAVVVVFTIWAWDKAAQEGHFTAYPEIGWPPEKEGGAERLWWPKAVSYGGYFRIDSNGRMWVKIGRGEAVLPVSDTVAARFRVECLHLGVRFEAVFAPDFPGSNGLTLTGLVHAIHGRLEDYRNAPFEQPRYPVSVIDCLIR